MNEYGGLGPLSFLYIHPSSKMLPLIFFDGNLQGVPVLVVLEGDVCAPVQEELQDGGESLLGRQVEGGRLVVVRRVHVRAVAFQQQQNFSKALLFTPGSEFYLAFRVLEQELGNSGDF